MDPEAAEEEAEQERGEPVLRGHGFVLGLLVHGCTPGGGGERGVDRSAAGRPYGAPRNGGPPCAYRKRSFLRVSQPVATDFGHTLVPDTPQDGSRWQRNPGGSGGVLPKAEDNTPRVDIPRSSADRVTT
ncbi:hypothetical protein GCM10009551_044530 [Nocardiopsis tropica]